MYANEEDVSMGKPLATPEERAAKRADDLVGVWWHAAAFLVVNIFLWALDYVTTGGIQWAYWVTIGWGVGLAFHIASYLIDDSGVQQRKYEEFLAQERERDVGA